VPAFVVVLDADVLYPFELRDILLLAAEDGLFQARWTDEILAELCRSLVRDSQKSEQQVAHLVEEMAANFPEADVPAYRQLVDAMKNDAKDRHVAAAAVAGHAQVIVTRNLKHFPSSALAPFGIEAQAPDVFLTHLFHLFPVQMIQVLERQVAQRNRPPNQIEQVLDILARQTPQFVQLVRQRMQDSAASQPFPPARPTGLW
jgi:predicted nucleic acid-binding protein